MGRKLYFEQDDGGIVFKTNRKIGDVRIPNYVYDLWMPIVGSDAIGIYAVYCRLEMGGSVKKISQRTLAKACRIGGGKLAKINDTLVECGFVEIVKPEGHKRLMHFTTEITINDPPQEIPAEIIAKYCPGFEPLTPWLVSPETPNGVSDDTKQVLDETPNGAPNIASLDLYPLEIVPTPDGEKLKTDLSDGDDPFEGHQPPTTTKRKTKGERMQALRQAAGGDVLEGALQAHKNAQPDDWIMTADAFCTCIHGLRLADMPESDQRNWPGKLKTIAEGMGASSEQMIAALRVMPEQYSGVAFKVPGSYSSPYVRTFEADIKMIVAKMAAGQLGPRGQQTKEWSGPMA